MFSVTIDLESNVKKKKVNRKVNENEEKDYKMLLKSLIL